MEVQGNQGIFELIRIFKGEGCLACGNGNHKKFQCTKAKEVWCKDCGRRDHCTEMCVSKFKMCSGCGVVDGHKRKECVKKWWKDRWCGGKKEDEQEFERRFGRRVNSYYGFGKDE